MGGACEPSALGGLGPRAEGSGTLASLGLLDRVHPGRAFGGPSAGEPCGDGESLLASRGLPSVTVVARSSEEQISDT